jgi:hypothetical protein
MLGITDWSQFRIAFWSSLFAGAIDSLLVGFIVGVMILVFQWKVDERRLRHTCEQEVATFREHLRFALNQAETTYIDNLVQPSSLATPVAKLLSESPLDLWIDKLPRQQKFFKILKEFQQAHSTFALVASKLNASVASAVRKINSSQGTMKANDSMLITYFTGKTFGGEADDIFPWVGLGGRGSPETRASFEANYNLLLDDEEVKVLAPLYKDAWQKLEKAIGTLRSTLNEPPNPKR